MTGRRLLAALGAVALIAAALVVRAVVFDDGEDAADRPDTPPATRTAVCATELAAACRDADFEKVTVEPPGRTADRLADGEGLGADVWVTTTPWPAMVRAARRDARIGEVGPPLASTDLVTVALSSRRDALRGVCPEPIGWKCVGDLAGTTNLSIGGRTVGVGIDSIDTTSGLLSAGAAATGYFDAAGLPGGSFARNDLDDDPGFGDWFARLAANSKVSGQVGSGSPLQSYLFTQAGASMVTELRAVAAGSIDTAAVPLVAMSFSPTVTTHAVVVGDVKADLRDRLARSLRESGWSAPTAASADAATGLPNSGVMVALRDRWRPS